SSATASATRSTSPTPPPTWPSSRCTTTSRGGSRPWPSGRCTARSPGGRCAWTPRWPAGTPWPTTRPAPGGRSWPPTGAWSTTTTRPTASASSATPTSPTPTTAWPTTSRAPSSTPTWWRPSSGPTRPTSTSSSSPTTGGCSAPGSPTSGRRGRRRRPGRSRGRPSPGEPLMGGAPRPPIMTRPLLLLFAASFGAMTGFYLLLSVVPLYAESVGAGGGGAGLVTGTLMAATVAGELAIPRLLARFGYRALLAAGLVLLGAPALALPASATMAAILLVTLVRGLGFAICVVVGGALVATLVPPERRGEGLGLFGIVVGVPGVAALPLGVWVVGGGGDPGVFVAGAVAALAGLAVVGGLPGREPASEAPVGVMTGLRTPALVRPAVPVSVTATAAGGGVTFLPLAGAGGPRDP